MCNIFRHKYIIVKSVVINYGQIHNDIKAEVVGRLSVLCYRNIIYLFWPLTFFDFMDLVVIFGYSEFTDVP